MRVVVVSGTMVLNALNRPANLVGRLLAYLPGHLMHRRLRQVRDDASMLQVD